MPAKTSAIQLGTSVGYSTKGRPGPGLTLRFAVGLVGHGDLRRRKVDCSVAGSVAAAAPGMRASP
jgi:hypothetical protein